MEVLLLYPVRSARRFVETPLACIHSASASPNVFCCSSNVFPPFLILILHDNLWNFNTYFSITAIILHQFVAVPDKAEGKKQLYKLPQFIIFNYFFGISAHNKNSILGCFVRI